jgi:hypothetical protein
LTTIVGEDEPQLKKRFRPDLAATRQDGPAIEPTGVLDMTLARSSSRLNRFLLCSALLAGTATIATPALAAPDHRSGHRGVVVAGSSHPSGDRHGRSHYDRSWDRHDHHPGHGSRRVEQARRYASQATAQAHSAWRLGCDRSHPRWSRNWEDHYYWALEASPRQLRHELNRRDDRLHECRARHRHHRHRGRGYYPY